MNTYIETDFLADTLNERRSHQRAEPERVNAPDGDAWWELSVQLNHDDSWLALAVRMTRLDRPCFYKSLLALFSSRT